MPRVVTADVTAALRDGARLATDVVRLDDGLRRPALLIRTPYSRPAARETRDVEALARDGWAVVVQDVRGRWDSPGRFRPFAQEADDGADAVAWCAAQPWCDGRVVMTGASYLGAAQWAAAARRPEGLVAINPMLAPATPPPDWLWQGGAFQIGMAAPWLLAMLASATAVPPAEAERIAAETRAWADAPDVVPGDEWLRELDDDYRGWRTHRPVADSWDDVRVPAFNVVGWHDFFAEAGLAAHARQAARGRPVTTVVGPWGHDPEVGATVAGEALGWLRARLDGHPATTEVRYVVTGTDEWRRSTTWPPPAQPVTLFLDEHRLSATPPATAGSASWPHDPAAPVPSCGGRVLGPFLPLPGARDQTDVERRRDVVTFTGAALDRPLVVTGSVTADLVASSTSESFDVTVKLCDVDADGRSVNVVDGITRIGRSGRHVHVQVGSVAHAFAAGHRVRVELAGSNFPRFDVNPQARATHRVDWGPSAPSRITLPVAAG